MNWWRRQAGGEICLIFKVDFKKALDSVDWASCYGNGRDGFLKSMEELDA